MKRDIDLARQLLLDIEARGADCSVSVLRTDANHDVEEQVRYHLRLLVDAGLLKEVDRTTSGVPCLRLTDAGHELIELSRSERRWRHAKWECQQRTGGLSLTVVQRFLLDGAVAPRPRMRRRYIPTAADTLFVDRPRRYAAPAEVADVAEPVEGEWDAYADLYDADWEPAAEARYVRVRPAYRNGWRKPYVATNGRHAGPADFDATLPEFLI